MKPGRVRSMFVGPVAVVVVASLGLSGAQAAAASSKLTWQDNRHYTVTAKIGGSTFKGKGTLYSSFKKKNTSVHAPKQVLGSGKREVVVAYGKSASSSTLHMYAFFTVRQGKLQKVTYGGGQHLQLPVNSSTDQQVWFACKNDRLVITTWRPSTGEGSYQLYKLVGNEIQTITLEETTTRDPVKPGTCF